MNIYLYCVLLSFGFFSYSFHPKLFLKQSIQLCMKKSKSHQSGLLYNFVHTPVYKPKTINQEKYVDYLNNYDSKIIIAIGPAGTGKTMFACQHAISQLKNDKIQKIIITRPLIPVEEDIGFLPGNIQHKMDPWLKPIYDVFLQTYSKQELQHLLHNEIIEICPLAFMRGRTFKNSFIIADEMQNSSPNQMKMMTTRIGDNSRMVITGDLKQSDILKENGLSNLIDSINYYKQVKQLETIAQVEFDTNDIERSDIVKTLIDIYTFNQSINSILPTASNSSININSIYDLKTKQRVPVPVNTTLDAAVIPNDHITENYYKFISFMER